MSELPSQIYADLLADESGDAYGQDAIHEVPEVRKTQLAEKSAE